MALRLFELNEGSGRYSKEHADTLLGAVTAGAFFVLLGLVFVTTPNLFNRVIDFFNGFQITRVTDIPTIGIYLPAPIHPAAHTVVYQAGQTFSYVWAGILVFILVLRYIFHSSIRTKADNFGDIVFWSVTGYLIGTMLNHTTTITTWFAFWAEIIILIGVSLVTRAVVLAIYGLSRR